ncbi:MAG: hypothetical protein COB36_00570 [Alphaproteobacteria bacterium]|nr:MAG: hypothetical protein COB36_00570 [Alphaproteobacteria bacterium]
MITEEFRQKLEELSARLEGAADYKPHDLCVHVPADMDIDGRDWTTLEDAWKGVKISVPHIVMKLQLSKDLSDKTYEECISEHVSDQTESHSFSLLAQGTSTVVMLAQSDDDLVIMRFSSHPETSNGKIMRDDCNRCKFPGLLQPLQENVIIGHNIMQAEILPLIQLHSLSKEDSTLYHEYMDMLLEDTVYENNMHELAILPDSTLIVFDPGELPYTNEYWELDDAQKVIEEKRSLDLILMRMESWDIPENLKPVNQFDELKQNISFERSSLYMHNALNQVDSKNSTRPEM